MILRQSDLFVIVVLVGTVGYPFLASVTNALGVSSGSLSIVMRALGLGAAIVLIGQYSIRGGTWVHLTLIFFWSVYLARIAQDTFFYSDELGTLASRFWIFGVGTVLIPLFSLLYFRREIPFDRLFVAIFVLSLIGLPLALAFASTSRELQSGVQFDIGRFELESLNPISLGHYAGGLLLLSYWRLRRRQDRMSRRVIFGVGLALGTYGLLLSASRGPILAVIAVLILFEISRKGVLLFAFVTVFSLTLLSLLTLDLARLDALLGVDVFLRMSTLSELSGQSSLIRLAMLPAALGQFFENPIAGDFIELREMATYPHNLVLESLMATGLLGTIPLIAAIGMALRISISLLRNSPAHSWVGMLFLQQLIAVQFSGALYSASAFWVSFGLLVATSRTTLRH